MDRSTKRTADLFFELSSSTIFDIAKNMSGEEKGNELVSELYITLLKIEKERLEDVIEKGKIYEFSALAMNNLRKYGSPQSRKLKGKEVDMGEKEKDDILLSAVDGGMGEIDDNSFREKVKKYFLDILEKKKENEKDLWYNIELFKMRYLQQKKYSQISEIGIPISTVHSAVQKALKEIQKHLRSNGIRTAEDLKEIVREKY